MGAGLPSVRELITSSFCLMINAAGGAEDPGALQIGDVRYVVDSPPPSGDKGSDTKWAKAWRFKRATSTR